MKDLYHLFFHNLSEQPTDNGIRKISKKIKLYCNI